jgi:hypothetical protein
MSYSNFWKNWRLERLALLSLVAKSRRYLGSSGGGKPPLFLLQQREPLPVAARLCGLFQSRQFATLAVAAGPCGR